MDLRTDIRHRWLFLLGLTGTLFVLQVGFCAGLFQAGPQAPVAPRHEVTRAGMAVFLIPQIVALIVGISGGLYDAWRARAAQLGCMGLAIGAMAMPGLMWLFMRVWEAMIQVWAFQLPPGHPPCCVAFVALIYWLLGYALMWHVPLTLPWIWWVSAFGGWILDVLRSPRRTRRGRATGGELP